jgi:hypothetical protein
MGVSSGFVGFCGLFPSISGILRVLPVFLGICGELWVFVGFDACFFGFYGCFFGMMGEIPGAKCMAACGGLHG